MAIYIFRCLGCSKVFEQTSRVPIGCPDCGSLVRRDYRTESVSFKPILHHHYHHAVGGPVSSMGQFRSELARKSEETWKRTGIESNYEPTDVRDHKPTDWEPAEATGKKVIY